MVVIEILLRLSALLLYIVAGLSALAALSGMILSVLIGLLTLDPFVVVILTMLSIIIFGSILRGATCLLDRIKIKINIYDSIREEQKVKAKIMAEAFKQKKEKEKERMLRDKVNPFGNAAKKWGARYRVNNLHCSEKEKGVWINDKGKAIPVGHILAEKNQWRTFMFPPFEMTLTEGINARNEKREFLNIPRQIYPDGSPIELHTAWRNLNSSQILTLNYFVPYLGDMRKLTEWLRRVGIEAEAKRLFFEYEIPDDHTSVDAAIELVDGHFVYIEVKYSETEFGPKDLYDLNTQPDAKELFAQYVEKCKLYKKVRLTGVSNHDGQIDFANAVAPYYQFIRNIRLSWKGDEKEEGSGNYTVFLFPRSNDFLLTNYQESCGALANGGEFEYRACYWEDLLNSPIDESERQFKYRYFGFLERPNSISI